MAEETDEDTQDQGPPGVFDEKKVTAYLGKYIIVGITKQDAFGKVTDQYQIHGVIDLVAPDGMRISLRGSRQGESYTIPPAFDWIHRAPPGEYRLAKSGEVITDPDFTASFVISAPQKHCQDPSRLSGSR